ncbi:MAG: hypothetical protein Kow0031_16360 [Anaerolineae bacterium]
MTDEQTNQQTNEQTNQQSTPPPPDPWQEVGRQFSALGESLAAAFSTTLNNPETRRTVEKMKTELNAAVEQLSQKATEVHQSEEAQKMQAEFQKAAHTAQEKGQEIYSQVQPELVSALRTVSAEFEKLIRHMEQPAGQPSATDTPADDDAAAPEETTPPQEPA